LKYRAEIDGLRALAVVPVILFHAGFEFFSGGFVGVDIFFVISGYLITTILIEDIENKRFSIVNFYERRARRILPALCFVMLITFFIAVVIMSPQQLKDFGQSLVATTIFLSNIYFFLKIDYWAQSSEFLPLLHTWSLAVEEQFYVLFPIFLVLAWRFGKNRVFWIIVVMAALSLTLSEWGWRNNAAANFYLAPTRAWEIFAGSIAAFIIQKNGVGKSDLLALMGLSAILFSIFAYDDSIPFPSVYALIPVVGVVLLILFASKGTIVAKLLSKKTFVWVGLISYSAYLWHQPLFALFRVSQNSIEISFLSKIFIIGVTFILAALSLRYVERPFRNKEKVSSQAIFYFSVLPIIIFSMCGLYLHKTDGLKEIKMSFLPSERVEYLGALENERKKREELWSGLLLEAEKPFDSTNKTKVLFIGDSLSEDLYVVTMSSEQLNPIIEPRRLAFDDECAKHLVTRKMEVNHNGKLCADSIDFYLKSSLFDNADVIFIASAWLSNAQYIVNLLEHRLLNNKRVVIYQTHGFTDISSVIYSLVPASSNSVEVGNFLFNSKRSRTEISNELIGDIATSRNIPRLNSFDAFCEFLKKRCVLFDKQKRPYIIDQAHLSVTGVIVFEKWLSKELIDILQLNPNE
jgi:peptidoglycan/LPS O-acetylase OafA/YrhL